MEYKQEFLDTCLEDFKPLLEEHWKEIALYQDTISLKPDYDRYYKMEEQGFLRVFTARKFGAPVGYFVLLVDTHLHYVDNKFAICDIIFVTKQYRSSIVGYKLIKFAEKCLKEDGVDVIMINTKAHKPFDRLLIGMGYHEVETLYGKGLY